MPTARNFKKDCPGQTPKPVQDISNNASCNVCTLGIYIGTREAYIELIIGGLRSICLLDTGSDVTLFPSSLVKGYKLAECSVVFSSSERNQYPNSLNNSVKALFKGREIIMNGLVTDHVQDVIIGLDWLQSRGALWNFDSGKLLINGEVYLLLNSQKRMFCRRLVLQESVLVPAQSEIDVPTMLIYKNYSFAKLDQEAQWMSEATDLETGIQTCRTLIPTRVKNVPLRVMNPRYSSQPSERNPCCSASASRSD